MLEGSGTEREIPGGEDEKRGSTSPRGRLSSEGVRHRWSKEGLVDAFLSAGEESREGQTAWKRARGGEGELRKQRKSTRQFATPNFSGEEVGPHERINILVDVETLQSPFVQRPPLCFISASGGKQNVTVGSRAPACSKSMPDLVFGGSSLHRVVSHFFEGQGNITNFPGPVTYRLRTGDRCDFERFPGPRGRTGTQAWVLLGLQSGLHLLEDKGAKHSKIVFEVRRSFQPTYV